MTQDGGPADRKRPAILRTAPIGPNYRPKTSTVHYIMTTIVVETGTSAPPRHTPGAINPSAGVFADEESEEDEEPLSLPPQS